MRPMTDAEVIMHARTEVGKVRDHGGRRIKDRSGQEFVLLELEVAERLVDLAQARVAGGNREP